MMRAIHWVVACVAVLVATTGQLHAAIITFTDRSAWEVAVGSFTLVDFNGIVSDHNIGVSGPFDAGPFTISAAGPFSSDNGIEAYDPNPTDIQSAGQDRNIDGTTYYSGDTDAGTVVTLAFDNPVFAFGFDYTSFSDGTPDNSFNVNGSSFLFPSSAGFFGLVDNMGGTFNSLTIEGNDGAWGADNFVLGQQTAAVPEPSSLGLFGIGVCVACAGAARRYRRWEQKGSGAKGVSDGLE